MKPLSILLIILIPIIIYLISFGFFVYNEQFYTQLTDEYSSVPEKAREMNPDMIDYFKTGNIPASFSEFSEKEKSHLNDVRIVINYLLILLMILIASFIVLIRYAEAKRKIFLYGGIITIIIPLLFISFPFDFLFTQMHNIFFVEGTWVFEGTDLIVNLYPFEFFFSFAKHIFLTGFCLGMVITFITWLSNRKK
ncbi:MAG: DUF1461 domain-containing protein [Candidatus Woesearchaeota archaeon]